MSAAIPAARATPGRLAPVDGLRAVAILGVMWWHAWIHTGNPALNLHLGGLDLNLERLLVPLGTGFQLFFVISGFCLCLSYQRLLELPIWTAYRRFLQRRWWRLSPAFYAVVLVTAAVLWVPARQFSGRTLLAHGAWLFGWIPGVDALSPVFWTLQVEWEFYLLLPLLFAGRPHGLHLPRLGWLMAASLVWRGWIHATPDGIAVAGSAHLPTYFMAFGWGMLAAEVWRRQGDWFGRLASPLPSVLGLGLVYLGRGLESTEVFALAAPHGWMVKMLSEPVMTLGYALVILGSLAIGTRLLGWLAHPFFQTTGRLSYGLYLWHWWPAVWLGHWTVSTLGAGPGAHYLSLGLTMAVTYPLAWLTYRTLEWPFLRAPAPEVSA